MTLKKPPSFAVEAADRVLGKLGAAEANCLSKIAGHHREAVPLSPHQCAPERRSHELAAAPPQSRREQDSDRSRGCCALARGSSPAILIGRRRAASPPDRSPKRCR